jgi:16S rRNA (guanine966-N2)-methyltransferase
VRIIAGQWGGRRIKAPPGRDTRPTTDRIRESWFSALGPALRGARVLDLFAGSGSLGLEALSRGASHAVFVELARKALAALGDNVATLEASAVAEIVRGDALAFASRLEPGAFDLAMADPPYERGFAQRLFDLWVAAPFANELWVEHRSSETLNLPPGARQRRYGDTTLTMVRALRPDRTEAPGLPEDPEGAAS